MNKVLLVTDNGMGILFKEEDIRPGAAMITGVKMKMDSKIIAAIPVTEQMEKDGGILLFTENGFAKVVALSEIKTQNRGGCGIILSKLTVGSGKLSATCLVSKPFLSKLSSVVVVTVSGKVSKFPLATVPTMERKNVGVKMLKMDASGMDESDSIFSVTIV